MLSKTYPELFNMMVSVLLVLSGYVVYRFTLTDYLTNKLKLEPGDSRQVIFQRISGVVLFGFLPAVVILYNGDSFTKYGIQLPGVDSYIWTLIISLIIIPVNYFVARSSENLQMYPQIRNEVWSVQLLLASAISWSTYLIAYEFMLRGYLFYTTLEIMGLWPSVMLNTFIYSLIHMHKGKREVIASVPMGIALCYLTYLTGNIWTSVFTHIIMALTNEWFSLYLHPSMIVRRIRR